VLARKILAHDADDAGRGEETGGDRGVDGRAAPAVYTLAKRRLHGVDRHGANDQHGGSGHKGFLSWGGSARGPSARSRTHSTTIVGFPRVRAKDRAVGSGIE